MRFIPQQKQHTEAESHEPLYFIIKGQEIVVKWYQDRYVFPSDIDMSVCNWDLGKTHFVGYLGECACYAVDFPESASLPDLLNAIPLRDALTQFSSHEIQAIGVAKQVLTWDRDFHFCGRCGKPTTESPEERAKVCTSCGLTNYPRLSPSIIVSVTRDDQILLARSPRFPNRMYSVLAGFVEPGETLEECIQREVREEVGIEVQNMQYFGSQNWPFPHSLMIGFTADYLRGEICIDNEEIVDAQWFSAKELPELPGSFSIARELIDHFLRGCVRSNMN